jgi:hypothetical protein
MPAKLSEKTRRYKKLLEIALADVRIKIKSPEQKVAEKYLTMARAYYNDGIYFYEKNDMVNALACFSYGHAWLDAGVILDVFEVSDTKLFTI